MLNSVRRALLILVGLTLPIEGLGTFSAAGYPISLNKLAVGMLLAFAVVSLPMTTRAIPWNRKHPWVIAFLIFGVATAGFQSVLRGGLPYTQLVVLLFSFAAVVIFYFLIPYVVTSRRDLDLFLWSLALGAMCSVLAGFVFGPVNEEASGRFAGSTANPNTLALNLSTILPLAFALLFSPRSLFGKFVLLGAISLSVAGVVTSLSRSAIVSLAAMWGLWVVRFRRANALHLLVPTIAIAAGIFWFAPAALEERMSQVSTDSRDGSIQTRIAQYYWAMDAFIKHPIGGVGLQQFAPYMAKREKRIPANVVHNAYLGVAAEMGLLGLVPIVALSLLAWKDYSLVLRIARSLRELKDDQLEVLAQRASFAQIAYLGTLLAAQFHPTLRDKAFWLMLALSSTLVVLVRERARELSAEDSVADPMSGPFSIEHGSARPVGVSGH